MFLTKKAEKNDADFVNFQELIFVKESKRFACFAGIVYFVQINQMCMKKKYMAPDLNIVVIEAESPLMAGSGESVPISNDPLPDNTPVESKGNSTWGDLWED